MIAIFKKIGLYFAKKIHLSKFKVLLSLPILFAVITSFTIKLDWNNKIANYNRDAQTYNEFITIIILLVILVLIDLIYEFLNNRYKERRRKQRISILMNSEISDRLKELYLEKDE